LVSSSPQCAAYGFLFCDWISHTCKVAMKKPDFVPAFC
jgi:hypothetical protein